MPHPRIAHRNGKFSAVLLLKVTYYFGRRRVENVAHVGGEKRREATCDAARKRAARLRALAGI